MRLALIRQRYTPYGGAERFVEAALEALLERDVAITLYTRRWPETRLQLIEPHVIDPLYVGRLWRDAGFARAVCRAIGKADLDLVQSHERLTCCDVYRAGDGVHAVWLEERLKGAPLATRAAIRASPYHRYVLGMERRMFASPWLRAVICNSRMVKDEIRAHFDVPDERLHVIYNAVDSEAFHPGLRERRAELLAQFHIPADAVVYLIVGSGFTRKGVATAIEALRELPPPAHLLVVGRDKRARSYERLARSHGVAARVTIAGPQMDPKPFYGAGDVFVLPTLYDPFPNAALEAMATGLPVLTSTKSGAAELVLEQDAGLVCPSREVAGLALHMRAMLDPATRARMGANARAAVLNLTPAAMTLELVLLYKRLLEESVAQRKAAAARRAAARAAKLKLEEVGRLDDGSPTPVATPVGAGIPPETSKESQSTVPPRVPSAASGAVEVGGESTEAGPVPETFVRRPGDLVPGNDDGNDGDGEGSGRGR